MNYIYVSLPLKSGSKKYLFSVPASAEITFGDTVIVKTKNGHEVEGTACSDTVALSESFLQCMKEEMGFTGEIQSVVGQQVILRFD